MGPVKISFNRFIVILWGSAALKVTGVCNETLGIIFPLCFMGRFGPARYLHTVHGLTVWSTR